MRIRRAKWSNCFCFRGEHEIYLDATVYGLVARFESDPEQSNTAGKSSLIDILGRFTLYGEHDSENEDGWITEGEPEGYSEIETDDGYTFRRSRIRGKTTQSTVTYEGRTQGQKSYEDAVVEIVGFTKDKFIRGEFIGQKQTDQLISMGFTKRQEIVSEWLGLSPLEDCEEQAKVEYRTALELEKKLEDMKVAHDLRVSMFRSDLQEHLDQSIEQIRTQEEKIKAVSAAQMDWKAIRNSEYDKEVLRKVEETLTENRKKLADVRLALDESTDESLIELTAIKGQVQTQKALVADGFDGKCPVSPGFECPARKEINARSKKHEKELKRLLPIAAGKQNRFSLREEWKSKASSLDLLIANGEDRKRTLEASIAAVPSEPSIKDPDPVAAAMEMANLVRERDITRNRIRERQDALESLRALDPHLEEVRTRKAVLASSIEIFRIARMRCAKAGLDEIESGANGLLADAGVNLSLKARWEKEGSTAAKRCDRCGEAYPVSIKFKNCSRCGNPRGKNKIDRLDIKLSSVSGGAKDMAGLALQLSAASWLRAYDNAAWSVVYMDEPLAALDRTNRMAIASKLPGMILGGYGFEQGFVSGHSEDTLRVLPDRIEILVKKNGDREVSVV